MGEEPVAYRGCRVDPDRLYGRAERSKAFVLSCRRSRLSLVTLIKVFWEIPMSNFNSERVGTTLLRVSLGAMFIAHSVLLKYFMYTLAGTADYFVSIGLPAHLAYLVFAAEAIGGVLLVLGIQTRIVALGLIPILVGAMWAHIGNGWVFSNANGGWEYPLYLIVISIVVALQAPSSVPHAVEATPHVGAKASV